MQTSTIRSATMSDSVRLCVSQVMSDSNLFPVQINSVPLEPVLDPCKRASDVKWLPFYSSPPTAILDSGYRTSRSFNIEQNPHHRGRRHHLNLRFSFRLRSLFFRRSILLFAFIIHSAAFHLFWNVEYNIRFDSEASFNSCWVLGLARGENSL